MRKTVLSEKDYNIFYKSIIYGKIEDSLYTAISVSYRDLCRTIRGFSRNRRHDEIYKNCVAVIYDGINDILECKKGNQELFDMLHKRLCDRLVCFSEGVLTYGQAQKWINMTFKNLSMLDHKSVEPLYEYFHVPIDNYVLKSTGYKLTKAWSKIDSYDEYMEFQKYFRNKYNGIPLDVEFNMWLKESRNM